MPETNTMPVDKLAEAVVANGGKLERRTDGTPVITIPVGGPSRRAASDVDQQMQIPVEMPSARRGADDRLRLLIERIERLEEEKKGVGDDIKDVYNELKAVGYDPKIARQVVRLRKMAPDDRREMESILDLYKSALGLD